MKGSGVEMRSRWLSLTGSSALVLTATSFALGVPFPLQDGTEPGWTNPLIKEAGAIRSLPDAAEGPRPDNSVVFDVTGLSDPTQPAKGIDRMARLLNLYADAEINPQRARFAIVLHGKALIAALSHESYRKLGHGVGNPNLALLDRYRELGVEVYVCGQSLAHSGYGPNDVAPGITIAVSAMNALINKQNSHYAYLPFF